MATLVVFAGTTDGHLQSFHSTYLTARSGGGTINVDTAATTFVSGQEFFSPNYYIYEGFVQFDTSALGASATVSAATLSLWGNSQQVAGSSAFTHNARVSNWGAALTSADYVAGASLSGLTLVAHLAQTSVSQGAYNDFVDDAMAANVATTATTYLLVDSSRVESASVPTSTEYEAWQSADTSGTTNDPKLTVTYTVTRAGDIYLLETSATDGYLLEDGSGVLLLESVTGTGALTLQPASAAGTGSETFTATGALALQPATVSGAGTETFTATGSPTLQPASAAGTGAETFTGTGAASLSRVTASGSGTETFTGTGALTLVPASAAGTGAETMTGTGAATLQPVTVTGSGTLTITGTGAPALQPLTSDGTGAETFTGSGSPTLQPVSGSGSGTLTSGAVGTCAFDPFAFDPAAFWDCDAENATGSGALTLQPVTAAGEGEAEVAFVGRPPLVVSARVVASAASATETGGARIQSAIALGDGVAVLTGPGTDEREADSNAPRIREAS